MYAKDCDAIPPPPPPVKGDAFYGNNTEQHDLGEFELINWKWKHSKSRV